MAGTEKGRNIITDKLVVEQTGKTIEEWFSYLDKKGASALQHKEIFKLIGDTKGLVPLGQWNQNLLTTLYEWNRGLKERGEKANGFEISISKTIGVPVAVLYASWTEEPFRKRWLTEKIIIRKATADKSARVTWSDQVTSLSVDFYAKGADKTQVVVQHLKIRDSTEAARLKAYWKEKLDVLKALLEA